MARRLLSIWFPRLACDLSLRAHPLHQAAHETEPHARGTPYPFALIQHRGNRDEIHCLNHAASAAGLIRNMGLADARAVCPALITRNRNPVQETRGLAALRRLAGRWSPHIGHEGEDGLILDITGVSHLFGGEEALLFDMAARFGHAGFETHGAIAPNRAAARAFAHYTPPSHGDARHDDLRPKATRPVGGAIRPDPGSYPRISPTPASCIPLPPIIGEEDLTRRLGPLPVAALCLPPETIASLSRLGIRRIADLIAQPRSPLARRFGPDLLLRLDQALGQIRETISPTAAAPHFTTRLTLPEPIGLLSDVMAALARLLTRLCEMLTRHQQGARRLVLELSRSDRSTIRVGIGLARAMRDPERMAALFTSGVSEIDAGFGIDAMRLSATVTEPLTARQPGLAPPRKNASDAPPDTCSGDALADLVSRLGNRLGFARIQRLAPCESLIPERSFLIFAAGDAPTGPHPLHHDPSRPQVIFPPENVTTERAGTGTSPPARFRWRRIVFTTLRSFGPERIAPEWWFDDPAWRSGLRDYWRIETCQGRRLWLFHSPTAQSWSVQGEFA